MKELSPHLIDKALYEKPRLKTVLIDNFANQEELRPLVEFREVVVEQSRDHLQKFLERFNLYFTPEQLADFEREYYGTI